MTRKAQHILLARLFLVVVVLAAILATVSAKNGDWATWAVDAALVVINGVGSAFNYRIARSL